MCCPDVVLFPFGLSVHPTPKKAIGISLFLIAGSDGISPTDDEKQQHGKQKNKAGNMFFQWQFVFIRNLTQKNFVEIIQTLTGFDNSMTDLWNLNGRSNIRNSVNSHIGRCFKAIQSLNQSIKCLVLSECFVLGSYWRLRCQTVNCEVGCQV